jgi:hypothetical protein
VTQDLTREQAFSRQGKIEPPSMLLPASTRLGPYESRRGKYRRDHLFFSGLAILFLVSVFIGFARSYYLAGLFKAPLPNMLLHVHGAVFSLWVLLRASKLAPERATPQPSNKPTRSCEYAWQVKLSPGVPVVPFSRPPNLSPLFDLAGEICCFDG